MDIGGWFYEENGARLGPVTLAELRHLVEMRIIGRETKVWAEGMPAPVAAGGLAVLFAPAPDAGLRWLLPVGRSGYAIAAGYLGIFSLIPFVGYVAILIAALAIRDLRRHRDKCGWGRVIFALVIAIPMTVIYTLDFIRP